MAHDSSKNFVEDLVEMNSPVIFFLDLSALRRQIFINIADGPDYNFRKRN